MQFMNVTKKLNLKNKSTKTKIKSNAVSSNRKNPLSQKILHLYLFFSSFIYTQYYIIFDSMFLCIDFVRVTNCFYDYDFIFFL